jgi:hypothetical protein
MNLRENIFTINLTYIQTLQLIFWQGAITQSMPLGGLKPVQMKFEELEKKTGFSKKSATMTL